MVDVSLDEIFLLSVFHSFKIFAKNSILRMNHSVIRQLQCIKPSSILWIATFMDILGSSMISKGHDGNLVKFSMFNQALLTLKRVMFLKVVNMRDRWITGILLEDEDNARGLCYKPANWFTMSYFSRIELYSLVLYK